MKILKKILSYIFDPLGHNISGKNSQKSVNLFTRFPFILALIAIVITALIFTFYYLV